MKTTLYLGAAILLSLTTTVYAGQAGDHPVDAASVDSAQTVIVKKDQKYVWSGTKYVKNLGGGNFESGNQYWNGTFSAWGKHDGHYNGSGKGKECYAIRYDESSGNLEFTPLGCKEAGHD